MFSAERGLKPVALGEYYKRRRKKKEKKKILF
jgi:hypothetical protein